MKVLVEASIRFSKEVEIPSRLESAVRDYLEDSGSVGGALRDEIDALLQFNCGASDEHIVEVDFEQQAEVQ